MVVDCGFRTLCWVSERLFVVGIVSKYGSGWVRPIERNRRPLGGVYNSALRVSVLMLFIHLR